MPKKAEATEHRASAAAGSIRKRSESAFAESPSQRHDADSSPSREIIKAVKIIKSS